MNKIRTVRDIVNLQRGQSNWYRIENAAATTADVYIYGYIGWDVTAAEFIKDLQAVTSSKINVHIATDGGDVFDGVAILNALRAHSAEVTTIVDSQALSAGSFIMQAGKYRKMMPNSTVMIHDASSGVLGNAADMRETAELLDKASNNIASIYAERADGSVEDWRAVMQAETWYSAQEAVDAGLADEVIELPSNASNGNKRPVQATNQNQVGGDTAQPEFDPSVFRKALQEVYK